MKNRIFYKSILIAMAMIMLAAALTGCGSEQEGQLSGAEEIAGKDEEHSEVQQDYGTSAAPDKMFTLRFTAGETLNPIYCDGVYNDAVTSLMYEGLFRLDENFGPVNVLCESYETEDGTIYYFDLINAKMHDGSALTAEDAAYSINLARDSSKYSSRLRYVTGCAATEDGRLEVTLSKADYSLPALLDIPVIKSGGGDSDVPVGTGPYVYMRAGDFHILKSFKEHRSYDTLPISMIYLKEFTDDKIVESFADYSLDLIWEDAGDEATVNLHSDHESRLYDTAVMQYIGFNSESTAMNDVNVRRAISSAVNRDYIVNDIYGGSGRASSLLLNPAYYLYDSMWESGYGYSPAMLSAYLAESKLADSNSDGFLEYPVAGVYQDLKIRFIVNSENENKIDAAENIAENLKRVGLNVELKVLSWGEYTSALRNGEFDMYYAEVSLTKNFDFSPLIGSGGSLDYGGMGSNDYDILNRAFLNATSEVNKTSAARNLCIIAAENAVVVPVMYRQYVIYTHRGAIENFKPSVSGVFSDVAEWTLNMPD